MCQPGRAWPGRQASTISAASIALAASAAARRGKRPSSAPVTATSPMMARVPLPRGDHRRTEWPCRAASAAMAVPAAPAPRMATFMPAAPRRAGARPPTRKAMPAPPWAAQAMVPVASR